jgi:succinoglycan biosynthesis protein ExoO
MRPDVSFIIAAFNAEDTIVRAVRSALGQRDVEVEAIVVDDRSVDGTLARLRKVEDSRLVVLEASRNGGPGAARNLALDVARGRYVAVLDADDTVMPDRAARLIGRAQRDAAQIVVDDLAVTEEAATDGGTDVRMFGEGRLRRLQRISLADFIAGNRLFAERFSLGYMKPLMERDFIEDCGLRYDETLRIGEDYIFIATALASGARCAVEPLVGYRYHVRDGSISRVLELHHVHAMMRADETFLERNQLDSAARAAQARRTRSLREAISFLQIVQHLKERSPVKAVKTAIADPIALRHLRMPIAARLRRLAGRATGKAPGG